LDPQIKIAGLEAAEVPDVIEPAVTRVERREASAVEWSSGLVGARDAKVVRTEKEEDSSYVQKEEA
jgi:hypothetical protein